MPEATIRMRDGRVLTVAQFGWQMGPGLKSGKRTRIFHVILPNGDRIPIAPDGHAKADVIKFKE